MKEKQVIISIGREFGSAGHEIAEALAEKYQLKLYDYHLLREIAEEKNVHVAELEPYDEIPKKGFGYRTVKGYSNSPQENIAYMQFNHLKKRAAEGESFVVLSSESAKVVLSVVLSVVVVSSSLLDFGISNATIATIIARITEIIAIITDFILSFFCFADNSTAFASAFSPL